jgi:D-alanyl-lipoteichoic acid acyltransferase DltB (MBOAT superfamily)
MLFNSYPFIFVFLPATLIVYFSLGRIAPRAATGFLAAASLFFYGWWNPAYLWLLCLSIAFNYGVGLAIARSDGARRSRLLLLGIAGDLLVLFYFKYFNFLLGTLAGLLALPAPSNEIVLPIGISFFTFTQIAFLVDTARGEVGAYDFLRYALFVTFFPHLLAGPLYHHKEIMPQFADEATTAKRAENLSVGLTIFIIGLFKKVVLADGAAFYAAPVFAAAAGGGAPDLIESWGGALAYGFQLYYDFSGYSDMAIGAARCFGIVLPLNFHSPYKAVNITEFWRRWHMTLSRFLRDYLYIPLGGNRHGTARRYRNLFLTMLLGGLWHGAAWTFVAWGALHGLYLMINHLWHALRTRVGWLPESFGILGRLAGIALTFAAVTIAWVPFRATSFDAALRIIAGMFGGNGAAGPQGTGESLFGVAYGAALYGGIDQTMVLAALGLLTFLAPNTQEFMARFRPGLPSSLDRPPAPPRRLEWQARPAWSLVMMAALLLALSRMSGVSPFLYYQF